LSKASRIVEALPEDPVAAEPIDLREQRVTARHEQREKRKSGRLVLEQRRHQVRLHVMHADRRHAPRIGQAAPDRRTDQQRTDEPWTARVGHGIDRRCRISSRQDFVQ
jgi:hypothetical protein